MAEIPAIESASPSSTPSWFTPKRLLVVLCIINMLNHVDQGAIASNGVNGSLKTCTDTGICTPGSGIQGDFNLTNFQDGVLSSSFIIGLVFASPTFASLAKSHNPFKLIGVGLSIWTFATAGCGSSFNFWSIAICRLLVGVGFASFISLAAPFIDDNAPVAQKTAWLAMFYMCIPTGFALGYVYGGLVGHYLNWRCAFWGEAILMLPFVVLAFVMKPLQLKGFGDGELKEGLTSEGASAPLDYDTTCHAQTEDQDGSFQVSNTAFNGLDGAFKISSQFSRFSEDMMALLHIKVYVVNILGSVFYTFVLGAYAYWGPKAGYSMYHMTNADMLFGVITIGCGIFGTLSGGYILDHMKATISNAFKLLSGATLLGATFLFSSFCFKSMNAFLLLFAVGELLIFATQAPASYVSLHSVKPSLRPLSMAVSMVFVRIFGDVPSSPLVGVLQDYVGNWRKTSLIHTSVLFLAAGVWLIGVFLNGGDPYKEDDISATKLKEVCTEPLLDDSTNQTGVSDL